MTAMLQVTPTLQVAPLIELRNADFAECYRLGLFWRIFGWNVKGMSQGHGPVADHDLMAILKLFARHGYFEEQTTQPLHHLGFVFGMIHGGVLTEAGELRADATTLLSIHDPYFAKGYASGRRWVRTCADDYRPLAYDGELVDLLVSVNENRSNYLTGDDEDIFFVIGSILGDLSCHVFPLTPDPETEPLPVVQAVEQPC